MLMRDNICIRPHARVCGEYLRYCSFDYDINIIIFDTLLIKFVNALSALRPGMRLCLWNVEGLGFV